MGVTDRRAYMFRRGIMAACAGSAGVVAVLVAAASRSSPALRFASVAVLGAVTLIVMDRLLRPRRLGSVPVLTYHSVAPPSLRRRWERIGWGNLTLTPELFDRHLAWLERHGYRTVDLDDLHKHVRGEGPPLRKAVVITFDDGYLDNRVFAAPLLERRGFRATVFVSSDFVEPAASLRPTLEDVWTGRVADEDLPAVGYLSWPELRELEQRGLFRVEAHGTTHAWCFAGEEIVDFYQDPDQYIWMFWNLDPARKIRWQEEERSGVVGLGRPVYAYDRSQVRRRYFEPRELGDHLVAHVRKAGGRAFFDHDEWRDELMREAAAFLEGRPVAARYESEAEYWERVRRDFGGNAADIERELGRRPRFLAWPGNAFTPGLRRLALEELGFAATTESGGLNRPGDDARWIGRVHIESHFEGTSFAWIDLLDFIARLEVFAGNGWYLLLTAPIALVRRVVRARRHERARASIPEGFRVMEAAP